MQACSCKRAALRKWVDQYYVLRTGSCAARILGSQRARECVFETCCLPSISVPIVGGRVSQCRCLEVGMGAR